MHQRGSKNSIGSVGDSAPSASAPTEDNASIHSGYSMATEDSTLHEAYMGAVSALGGISGCITWTSGGICGISECITWILWWLMWDLLWGLVGGIHGL